MTEMKKILMFIIVALCMTACGDDEPKVNQTDKRAAEIAAVLNGRFVSSVYSQTTNTTEVTDITFQAYSEPVTEEWTGNGTSKKVVFYGTCDVVTYYNDHLLEVSRTWKYNIRVAYDGAQPELNFYPEAYGLTETHKLSAVSSSSFMLDNKTFTKQ